MSAISYERAVELTAQMYKRYQETEERLESLLSEKRTSGEKSRNEARMQEEHAEKKAADEKRKLESLAAAERIKQEEKAKERRDRMKALYRGLISAVAFATSWSLCLAGLYVIWWNLLSENPASEFLWFRICLSAFVIFISWCVWEHRFEYLNALSRCGIMLIVYYFLRTTNAPIFAFSLGVATPVLWWDVDCPPFFTCRYTCKIWSRLPEIIRTNFALLLAAVVASLVLLLSGEGIKEFIMDHSFVMIIICIGWLIAMWNLANIISRWMGKHRNWWH